MMRRGLASSSRTLPFEYSPLTPFSTTVFFFPQALKRGQDQPTGPASASLWAEPLSPKTQLLLPFPKVCFRRIGCLTAQQRLPQEAPERWTPGSAIGSGDLGAHQCAPNRFIKARPNPALKGIRQLKVLQCHNLYQLAGGEDRVVEDERELLTQQGHQVAQYQRHNDDIENISKLRLAAGTLWSRRTVRELRELVKREKPNIAHFHNTVPLMSPAAYHAVRGLGVPVVQTLHNYRLLCPKATFLRDDNICEDCLGKRFKWPAIKHACYRDNRSATAALTTMLTIHGAIGTYRRQVDAYIACSNFTREKMIEGGLPAQHIYYKPNFVSTDPGPGSGKGGYALYLGRLSAEKGIKILIEAWETLAQTIPLTIVGTGPLQDEVKAFADRHANVTLLGWVDFEELNRIVANASCLVLPTMNYEGFPKVIVEAFAHGLPVVATDIGAMRHAVVEGVTGHRHRYGDAQDMARVVKELFDHPQQLAALRITARETFEREYTAQTNYDKLLNIYEHARDTFNATRGTTHRDSAQTPLQA